jgi:hypothetical protein
MGDQLSADIYCVISGGMIWSSCPESEGFWYQIATHFLEKAQGARPTVSIEWSGDPSDDEYIRTLTTIDRLFTNAPRPLDRVEVLLESYVLLKLDNL